MAWHLKAGSLNSKEHYSRKQASYTRAFAERRCVHQRKNRVVTSVSAASSNYCSSDTISILRPNRARRNGHAVDNYNSCTPTTPTLRGNITPLLDRQDSSRANYLLPDCVESDSMNFLEGIRFYEFLEGLRVEDSTAARDSHRKFTCIDRELTESCSARVHLVCSLDCRATVEWQVIL